MASWNVFKFCTALKALGAVMVAVVLGLAGFTYYAVVFVGYGPLLPSGGLDSFLSVVVLLLFHSLLAMLLWSYFATVLTDPGGVPPNWMPVVDEELGEGDAFVGSADADSGLLLDQNLEAGEAVNHRRRFCRQCNMFKPQRSHHCSVCGRCILKMDHHCVWVVNCVGALNYKYFLLFLFYTFLVTALVTVSLMPPLIAFLTADGDGDDDDDDVSGRPGGLVAMFIACVLNLSFSLSVFGFLAMHVSLVLANKTTIEIYEKKKGTQWQYDLGQRKNFEQVFGVDKRYWLLPAYSDEDRKFMPVLQGLEYPTRSNSDDLRQL